MNCARFWMSNKKRGAEEAKMKKKIESEEKFFTFKRIEAVRCVRKRKNCGNYFFI